MLLAGASSAQAQAHNDNRAAAQLLPTGVLIGGDNTAASDELGERLNCRTAPYAHTVWPTQTSRGT